MNIYYDIKLIIVGDSNTGKSTFINQIINNKYKNIYEPTIGVDFYITKKFINNNKIILNIWDMSGNKQFNNYTETYIRNSTFALIFFDINNENSFYNIKKWYNRIKTLCPNILNIALIGSKIDIYKNKIDFCGINSLSKEYNIKFFLISSKNKKNIDKPICYLLNSLDFQNINYNKKIGIYKIDKQQNEDDKYDNYCCNIF
jgi:small GTP-binding protein